MQTSPKPPQSLLQTNFNLSRQHSDEIPYPIPKQIDIMISNIKFYQSVLLSGFATTDQIQDLKKALIVQLEFINSDFVHTQKLEKFQDTLRMQTKFVDQGYVGFRKVDGFANKLKVFMDFRANTQSQEDFNTLNQIIQGLLHQMSIILMEDNYTINRLEKYEPQDNNLEKSYYSQKKEPAAINCRDHFRPKQKIIFSSEQCPEVFQSIDPPLHRVYLSEVTKAYHDVVPFKIKYICLANINQPRIDTPSYFNKDIEAEKAVVFYCQPGTKNLISYSLDYLCKALTYDKSSLMQVELPVNWTFTNFTKTVITPDGRIFAINCRTTEEKQDQSLYEITPEKVSNRGRIPEARRNAAIVYCNKSIYIIGGNTDSQKCSSKNFKYSLREKKWVQISNSRVPTRKSTVCSFRDRYILKIGGLNQFDYINKQIQMYDTTTDKWSLVRSTPRNILEEVKILEESLAVQIYDDQVYVFAGKNTNGYPDDSGLVLQFLEIREKIKAPAKVTGEIWNVSVGQKSILSYFGTFSQSNVIIHGNCIYTIRSQTSQFPKF